MSLELNLQSLYELVQIYQDQILNVYITGSRVYKTTSKNSDYDVKMVVVDDYAGTTFISSYLCFLLFLFHTRSFFLLFPYFFFFFFLFPLTSL